MRTYNVPSSDWTGRMPNNVHDQGVRATQKEKRMKIPMLL